MPKIIAKKEDWIKLGYRLFSEEGITGIIIEKLGRKLKCNKSSFYWHFKSKDEFVVELVKYWIKTETEHVILHTEKAKNSKDKINQFLAIAFKKDPYLEFIFFLKRYATTKPAIQNIIDEIDTKRLAYTASLFKEMGYKKKHAAVKARIFYNYLIGYHEMLKNKKQPKNYLDQVKKDLSHFIEL